MIKLYQADAYEELDNQFITDDVDFILTDTLYDLSSSEKEELHNHFVRISRNGYINFSPPKNPFLPMEEATHNFFWVKPLSTKNYKVMRKPSQFVELCQFYQEPDREYTWNGKDLHWSMSTNVMTDIVHHNDLHKWRKPLSLIKRLIKLYTNPGDIVLDPFCGSGVVAEACMHLGRNFTGFDIDPEIINITINRLEIINNNGG